MYPQILGFIDSYTFMEILGILLAFVLAIIYLKRKHFTRNDYIDLCICGLSAVFFGLLFALLFQNLNDFLDYVSLGKVSSYRFQFRMTFYGGLFGGVIGFLFVFYTFIHKTSSMRLGEVLKIGPACITVAHSIGRIGCFMAGCCYGMPSEYGFLFHGAIEKRIPTQLYEALFLAILSIILIILAFKNFKFGFVIYLVSYSIFRFIIEFFRGDNRGFELFNLSPSQWWAIFYLLAAVPLLLLANKYIYRKEEANE
jgi:phosphatidylglycerol:prolipoprotein diacylglycerol transferase